LTRWLKLSLTLLSLLTGSLYWVAGCLLATSPISIGGLSGNDDPVEFLFFVFTLIIIGIVSVVGGIYVINATHGFRLSNSELTKQDKAIAVIALAGIPLQIVCYLSSVFVLQAANTVTNSRSPLLGEWRCVSPTVNCMTGESNVLGDITWKFSDTLAFSTGGIPSYGDMFFQDGTVTSGNLTCVYKVIDDTHVRIDCGFGSSVFEYTISENTLTFHTRSGLAGVLSRVK